MMLKSMGDRKKKNILVCPVTAIVILTVNDESFVLRERSAYKNVTSKLYMSIC